MCKHTWPIKLILILILILIYIYHLTREMAPSEKTALQCVMEVDEERIKLEKEAERLAHEDCELHTHICIRFLLY